ncbi:MAG: hypothetical protein M0Q48_07950 [Verrucomicrobia bacterium]|nr:hypothetical protein [Verrucomicrobiota bacterium]
MVRGNDQLIKSRRILIGFTPLALIALIFFIFLGGSGCKVASSTRDAYLVGIYAPGNSTNYAMLRDVGFSHIVSSANLANLDAAHSAGLRVIAPPGLQAHQNFDTKRVWRTVRKADKHPALYAWYLIDEPDMSKTDPGDVQHLNSYLKAKSIKKPTTLVMFKGYEAFDYANIPDIMMLDRYPIGWQPIETFSKHLRLARYAAGPEKPLIAVIQVFDWSYYPQVFGAEGKNTRPPTLEEIRNMTWSSLALGATGIFYYCYDSGWKMKEHPQQWDDLQKVVSEIRLFEPLFSAEHDWWEKKIQYLNPEQSFNEVYEPSILSAKLIVKKGNEHLAAGEYIVCVNTTTQFIDFKISLPSIRNGSVLSRNVPEMANHLSESRDGFITEKLDPFQTRIYGPLLLY